MIYDYDAFLIDAWGVLHDGVSIFSDAVSCLKSLQSRGKNVVILSNAARRETTLTLEMQALGIPPDCYHFLFTSGEQAWQALNLRILPGQADWGDKCLFIGPSRSRSLLDDLSVENVTSLQEAGFLFVTGVNHPDDDVGKYEELLQSASARNMHMVCANSDRVAVRAGQPYFCGGALAHRYREFGGTVFDFGKPYRPIYDKCLSVLPQVPPSRILAIGDAFETDVAGASNAGIDSLFIKQGIHAELFTQKSNPNAVVEGLIKAHKCQPQAMMEKLYW